MKPPTSRSGEGRAAFERGGRRKRYEEIVDHVQLMIFSGALGIGDQLPSERELMDRFGVGRSSVREALFALGRMGLISVSTGAPARVVSPDIRVLLRDLTGAVRHLMVAPEGIRQLQQARALLEIGLAREAAARATDEDIVRLKQALDENEASIGGSVSEFERTDLAFHYAIATVAANPIFTGLLNGLAEWLAEQRSTTVRAGATPVPVFADHKAIYEAIAARDIVAAPAAMQRHLDNVVRTYWEGFAGTAATTPKP